MFLFVFLFFLWSYFSFYWSDKHQTSSCQDKRKSHTHINYTPEQQSQWNQNRNPQSPSPEIPWALLYLSKKPISADLCNPSPSWSTTLPCSSHWPPPLQSPISSSSPGRSLVSSSGRLTTSCSLSLKITLHEAEARQSKFNCDTKVRSCLSPSAEKPSSYKKRQYLIRIDYIILNVNILCSAWRLFCWCTGDRLCLP